MSDKMDDRQERLGQLGFSLMVGPFLLAIALFGCSVAVVSARFLFDVVLNCGRLSPPVAVERK